MRGPRTLIAVSRFGLPAWRLLTQPASGERIFCHTRWGADGNQRYSQLLPRLGRVDPLLIQISSRRPVRAVQSRLLAATSGPRDRLVFAAANRKYRWLLATNHRQVAMFEGGVVVDVDDPEFSDEQVALLNRPNVRAYVVTTDRARERFESLGVRTPGHVISQGVDFSGLTEAEREQIAEEHRRPGELVVGYVARWLLADPNGKGNHPLDGVAHLLELWDMIRVRVPSARLWLVGAPDAAARKIAAERPEILLLGRIPQSKLPAYIANFDLALYPRRVDHAPMPIKLAEYIALGVPTVSYDLELSQVLRDTGTGRLASNPDEFVAQVEGLARDGDVRARISAAGHALAPSFDWDALAERYRTTILDRYLR